MNKSKLFYSIVALLVVAAIVVVTVKVKHNSKTSMQNQNTQNQASQDQSSQPANNQQSASQITGCPDGQNVTQTDSNGRFKPTLDISNKTVTLNTSMGKIQLALYDKDAPK